MIRELVFCTLLVLCFSVPIPSNLKKCNRKDSDFSKCLIKAVEDAVRKSPAKKIGLQSVDPIQIPSLVIGAGSGTVNFEQNFKKMKLSGLSKMTCSKIDVDVDAKTMYLECKTPLARLDFNYEINGKLLVLPISGKGPGFIELHGLEVQQTFNFEEYEKKGVKHLKVAKNKFVMTPTLLKFQLDNLFDGDKTLGDNINQVLNENWKDVFDDVKLSYEEAFGAVFANIFNRVLGKVSEAEIFGE